MVIRSSFPLQAIAMMEKQTMWANMVAIGQEHTIVQPKLAPIILELALVVGYGEAIMLVAMDEQCVPFANN